MNKAIETAANSGCIFGVVVVAVFAVCGHSAAMWLLLALVANVAAFVAVWSRS